MAARNVHPGVRWPAGLVALTIVATACSASGASTGPCTPPKAPVITFAAYSTPREVYGKLIPAFQERWKADHDGQQVVFQESYGGSTTQAQNVVNGFPADVVALSLGPDVDLIKRAGLITHDWTAAPNGGAVSASIVVFDVRPGNPKGIRDWSDLVRPGLRILTPDPAQSGGARWNIVAAYGAAERGKAAGVAATSAGAERLLEGIFGNVTVLDKSARDSIKNFESGNGDVAITYENEVLTARQAGLPDEAVVPPSTVLVENPAAVVDRNAEQHCVADVAAAFVDFLHSKEAQEIYQRVGFLRPTDPGAATRGAPGSFPPVHDLFTVGDLGGWDRLDRDVFGPTGTFTTAFKAVHGG